MVSIGLISRLYFSPRTLGGWKWDSGDLLSLTELHPSPSPLLCLVSAIKILPDWDPCPQCHVAAIQLSVTARVSPGLLIIGKDWRAWSECTWYKHMISHVAVLGPGHQVGLPAGRKISSGDQITICNVVTYTNINIISCQSLSNQPGPRQGPTDLHTANQDTVLLYFHQLRPSWSGQDYTQHLEILKTKLLATLTGSQTGTRSVDCTEEGSVSAICMFQSL